MHIYLQIYKKQHTFLADTAMSIWLLLCFAHMYMHFPANWEQHVSWTALSNYVSVVLEEILRMVWFKTENHNIYHLTTEDTKIYDITKKTQT